MSLRNQPYFPLYVQDYLTDEKLNMCSWLTQGIYIKILCVFHKQEEYGSILFKQKDKQNFKICLSFASILLKQIPCLESDMIFALEELIEHGVLKIEGNRLYQKRMYKDGAISLIRSKVAKKGGGNPILFKQKVKQTVKQTDKQNPEYENEYESINEDKEKKEEGVIGGEGKKEKDSFVLFLKKEYKMTDSEIGICVRSKNFYDIELSEGKVSEDKSLIESYERFILFLFGDNEIKQPLTNLLNMEKQVTYSQFKNMDAWINKNGFKDKVKLKLLTMNNYKDLCKKNKMLYSTLQNWLNKDDEKAGGVVGKGGMALGTIDIQRKTGFYQ